VGAGRYEAFHAMLDRSAAVYLGRRVVAGAQKAPTLMSRGLRSELVGHRIRTWNLILSAAWDTDMRKLLTRAQALGLSSVFRELEPILVEEVDTRLHNPRIVE